MRDRFGIEYVKINMQTTDWLEKIGRIIPASLYAPAIVVAWMLALWLVKRLIVRRLTKWASKTSQRWDDIIVGAISFPANFLILASGLALLTSLLTLPKEIHRIAAIAFQGCLIFAIVFFLDSFVKLSIDRYASKNIFSKVSHNLTKGLIRGFIIGIGVLLFLDLMGISITPILASLGIGSLAVALALQDTLSNFFAGLYVAIDKPVEVGDLVRLENGNEGFVIDVGWRSTKLRTFNNTVVIIPNSKLMGSVITNYDLPEKEFMVTIEVGVHYSSDLGHVEKVTGEVAKEVIKKVPGAVADFEPVVRFHTLGDSGIHLTVVLKAKEFLEQHMLKHEFIKAIHARYRREGIQIPYPTRSLELSKEVLQTFKSA